MKRIDLVYQTLLSLQEKKRRGVSAAEVGGQIGGDRANVSRYLNQLVKLGRISKTVGKPVLFSSARSEKNQPDPAQARNDGQDKLIGADLSLRVSIQQAKAAVLYPPNGLHTLILGETGTGKSMFAEFMYRFAREVGAVAEDAPFICFNCADYADNPQLLMAQLFGVKRGAYTGADQDREGLLKRADGGFLLLDEVHRLPPQGQEMLFTYMDKGVFRPLGGTEPAAARVRIVAATAEDPPSHFLQAFRRRIPITIVLPSLRERSLRERYSLIESFIREESNRVGRGIYIDKGSLIAFLLYECPGNIGQLRSDVQLACAKAFLAYRSQSKSRIVIGRSDIPNHVQAGLLRIHDRRDELEKLPGGGEDSLYSFPDKGGPSWPKEDEEDEDDEQFYDVIEKRLERLREAGVGEDEISQILNVDIERRFHTYLGKLPSRFRKEEISKVVGDQIVGVVERILSDARRRLNREYDEKMYCSLALHLHRSIDRIRGGHKIYNPRLNLIRASHPDEFLVALEIARIVDTEFHIQTPLDEIGYLTMFLALNPEETEPAKEARVGILVMMHGNATATSMAQAANSLVGVEHAAGLDMPLHLKPEAMYEMARRQVIQMDKGKGVLLLVDMGSLVSFGDMLRDETGIEVMTVDMASTPLVIEACRKAAMGCDLAEVYESCGQARRPVAPGPQDRAFPERHAIIVACYSGKGAAEELKRVIEREFTGGESLTIIPLSIIDRREFSAAVARWATAYRVLAIVGTVEVRLEGVPFVPAIDVLTGDGIDRLRKAVRDEQLFFRMAQSLKEHLPGVDAEKLVDSVRCFVGDVEKDLQITVPNEAKVGITMHTCFMVAKLSGGGEESAFTRLEEYRLGFEREMALVGGRLRELERRFNVRVGENETAYLCEMFLRNAEH